MSKMSKGAREAKNEYYRKWRAKNPDKVKASNQKYWERISREQKGKEIHRATENEDDQGSN